jgi:Zn-dependent M16 (insulinase) family peptidase
MKKGDTMHGFDILDTVDLEELKAQGIWARHRSGAEVFHVLNDDPENLFGFAFATAPEDSTGAAHILEHSVLCGSEQYPLKDAFLVLAQGSLQTFLNAWTFLDKTVYPASSVNEKDYFNLMSVYADAVFRPLLSEWTFLQEGWRLVPAGTNGLEYTGVVYNEMKGAYSSMDTYAGLWSVKGVMPGTPYAFESGGDPDCIPLLSWEALKEFHRTRYAPANCKIFLAGNIDTKKQLAFLDGCLAGLAPGQAAPLIPKTERWKEPKTFRIPCPGNDQEENKNQALLSWLCSDNTEPGETMALACLAEILLGHDGSPLTRALVESGLGEDLSPVTGLASELRETVFSAGLRGIKNNGGPETAYGRMEGLILGELRRLAKEGIPQEEIEAALLSIEFSHREIKRSHGPYSLVWMRRALRGWLYGQRPWESLLFVPEFARIKHLAGGNGVYTRYFESLIEKYLLNNPHHALIAIEGEADYLPQKEAERTRLLAEKAQSLSKTEKKLLTEKAAELEKIQGEGESKAALETIPHLSRGDLVPEVEKVPTEFGFLSAAAGSADIPCMVHPLFTNGISYADLAFPVDVLLPEDYPWLPFFARAVVSLGLPGMDYGEVSGLLARTAGGFHALLETGSAAPDSVGPPPAGLPEDPEDTADLPSSLTGRDWIIYRIKALDEKFAASLDLAHRLMAEADFSDLRRLRDLALEMKNDGDSSLAASGHSYASGRSGKFFSRSRAIDELWNGLDQIPFAHTLASMDMGELRDRMLSIRDALLGAGLCINITASREALAGARKAAEIFGRLGAPGPARPREKERFFSLLSREDPAPEVYASPSLQIGFAAMSLPAVPYGSPAQAAELALSHELSTGALWESIRMMGGAYGAFAHPDNLEGVFSLATYRDPDPLRSLKAFPPILKKRGSETIDEDSLEKIIIGTFAGETRPRTPAGQGFSEFLRRLYGIRRSHRLSHLKALVGLKAEETGAAARRLARAAEQARDTPGTAVVITGPKQAEKAAKKLGTTVKILPV